MTASELDVAGKELKRAIPHAWLVTAFEESDALPLGDGAIDLRLSSSGADVVVHGRARAEVELPCSRCLEPVKIALRPEISVLLVPTAKLRKGEKKDQEITSSEADVLPFDGENVILDDLVRDDLLLEVPMIPLCSETCPGIASAEEVREQDRQIDPRLAPLLALKNRKKE